MRFRVPWVVPAAFLACVLGSPAAPADDGVSVVPGDPDGLFGAPTVGLGARHTVERGDQGRTGQTPDAYSGSDLDRGGVADPTAGEMEATDPPCLVTPALMPGAPVISEPVGFTREEPTGMRPGTCGGLGQPGQILHWPPPEGPQAARRGVGLSPEVLVQEALRRLQLPEPVPRHSPDVATPSGARATVVGEHTWFWTDGTAWAPQTQRVQVGPVWVAVEAEPVRLRLAPGGGQPPLSCVGPGTRYTRDAGVHAASPSGCSLVYPRPTAGPVEYAITWRVRWHGSDGTRPLGGALPTMTSRASAPLEAREIQALRAE